MQRPRAGPAWRFSNRWGRIDAGTGLGSPPQLKVQRHRCLRHATAAPSGRCRRCGGCKHGSKSDQRGLVTSVSYQHPTDAIEVPMALSHPHSNLDISFSENGYIQFYQWLIVNLAPARHDASESSASLSNGFVPAIRAARGGPRSQPLSRSSHPGVRPRARFGASHGQGLMHVQKVGCHTGSSGRAKGWRDGRDQDFFGPKGNDVDAS